MADIQADVQADVGRESPGGGGGAGLEAANQVVEAKVIPRRIARTGRLAAPFANAADRARRRFQGQHRRLNNRVRSGHWLTEAGDEFVGKAGQDEQKTWLEGRLHQGGGSKKRLGNSVGAAADTKIGAVAAQSETDRAGESVGRVMRDEVRRNSPGALVTESQCAVRLRLAR